MVDLDPAQQAVLAMLRADDFPVFNGGLVDDAGQDTTPPVEAGSSRVMPHAIVYFAPGLLVVGALNGLGHYTAGDFAQVTCVGPSPRHANWCVTQVRSRLAGQPPIGIEESCGLLQETTNPGPVRPDRGITPYRWYLPLMFGLTVT